MEFIGYFPQWSIYERGVFLKTLDDNGTAERLTILNYAFENIASGDVPASTEYPEGYSGYRCFEEVRALKKTSQPNADNGINAGDAGADWLTPFNGPSKPPIGGNDPGWGAQQLMGNFNQLRKLKAKHKQLKVLVSLGGWTYSRNWSLAAKTQKGREELVSSCIDLFIKGNLPTEIWQTDWQHPEKPPVKKPVWGGSGAAKGIFDGVDIDWEWPGCDKGLAGNKFDPVHDKANFVALLKEFRKQLDDPELVKKYPPRGGKYLLTAFLPADPSIMAAGWDAPEVMKCLDFGNIQGYDFHGAGWPGDTVTDQQSALLPPATGLTAQGAVDAWIKAAGESIRPKLTLGIPYYGRGWQNVGTEHSDGLHNSATEPAKAKYENGVSDYREIAKLGDSYKLHYSPDKANCSFAWRYSETDHVFWTYDDPALVYRKAAHAKKIKLGGVMAYSLDGDDPTTGVLSQQIRAGLDGTKPPFNGVNGN
ncbi:glycosyl hydrolase family 18 protein [Streptomyces klenkii]|uniref:glycoside hydrolase family 18 protein n=1 Tax=Streptomyces klenkii TaxID=1420899 RepID=UPI0033BD1A3F